MTVFGLNTRVKFVGGEVLFQSTSGGESRGSFPEWIRMLTETKRRALDLRIPFQQFQPYWFADIATQFDTEGGDDKWPELSPAYRNWKAHTVGDRPMMRLTDRLYDSLTSLTSDTIWLTTPRTIQFSSRVPYFIAHQEGALGLPQRQTLVLSPTAFAVLNGLVGKYVQAAMF